MRKTCFSIGLMMGLITSVNIAAPSLSSLPSLAHTLSSYVSEKPRAVSESKARQGTVLITYTKEAEDAARLHKLPIALHPGIEHRTDSAPTPETEQHCKAVVYRAFANLPSSHMRGLEHLTLFYTENGRRGLGGVVALNGKLTSSIVLRCLNMTDEEISAVLLHELGHIVDTYGLFRGDARFPKSAFDDFGAPIYMNDTSVEFYSISWIDSATPRDDATETDFCSQYGATDPFEDFAECYTLYRLHGSLFRHFARFSPTLQTKYDFMKNKVFFGEEFGSAETRLENPYARHYDTTILPYDLRKLWLKL